MAVENLLKLHERLESITDNYLTSTDILVGPLLPSQMPGTEEWLQKLGSLLPLLAQPGERWMYQVSSDVLGVLIGRVSGQSLGTFMRERIFDPLGMKDTVNPPHAVSLLPQGYSIFLVVLKLFERIYAPLTVSHPSGFQVPSAKIERLPGCFPLVRCQLKPLEQLCNEN